MWLELVIYNGSGFQTEESDSTKGRTYDIYSLSRYRSSEMLDRILF